MLLTKFFRFGSPLASARVTCSSIQASIGNSPGGTAPPAGAGFHFPFPFPFVSAAFPFAVFPAPCGAAMFPFAVSPAPFGAAALPFAVGTASGGIGASAFPFAFDAAVFSFPFGAAAFGFAEVRGGEETSLVVRVLNDAAHVVATEDRNVGRMTDVVMLKPRARGSVSLGWSEPLLMDLRTRGLRNKSRFS